MKNLGIFCIALSFLIGATANYKIDLLSESFRILLAWIIFLWGIFLIIRYGKSDTD